MLKFFAGGGEMMEWKTAFMQLRVDARLGRHVIKKFYFLKIKSEINSTLISH